MAAPISWRAFPAARHSRPRRRRLIADQLSKYVIVERVMRPEGVTPDALYSSSTGVIEILPKVRSCACRGTRGISFPDPVEQWPPHAVFS